MKDLIKRHKGLMVVLLLTLVLVIVMFLIFAKMIFSNGNDEYGERLDGISKVSKGVISEVVSLLEGDEVVVDADVRIQGRIIYTTIIYKEGTNRDTAKEIASRTISEYNEEILNDYDLGYFIKEDVSKAEEGQEQKVGFIYAGTKHPTSKEIIWTK